MSNAGETPANDKKAGAAVKIIVFGATGGVGQHVVTIAQAAGHDVTAFVRTPEKLRSQDGINVVQGDALNTADVAAAIVGQDAVISCLSSSDGLKKSNELAAMAKNIAAGMEQAGVARIAYCGSLGVDNELTGVVGKLIGWMLRHPLADHRAAIAYLKAADRNITVARPTNLTTGDLDENYLEAMTGMPGAARPISRASVAHFLVKAIEQPETYSNTSVGLALGAARK